MCLLRLIVLEWSSIIESTLRYLLTQQTRPQSTCRQKKRSTWLVQNATMESILWQKKTYLRRKDIYN